MHFQAKSILKSNLYYNTKQTFIFFSKSNFFILFFIVCFYIFLKSFLIKLNRGHFYVIKIMVTLEYDRSK